MNFAKKIICFLVVAAVCTSVLPISALTVYAAGDYDHEKTSFSDFTISDTQSIDMGTRTLSDGQPYTLRIRMLNSDLNKALISTNANGGVVFGSITVNGLTIDTDSSFVKERNSSSPVSFYHQGKDPDYFGGEDHIEIVLGRMQYKSDGKGKLRVTVRAQYTVTDENGDPVNKSLIIPLDLAIPERYLPGGDTSVGNGNGNGGSGSTGKEETISYNSAIVIENVILRDSAGNRLDEVTKDSPRFNMEIIYADYGDNLDSFDFGDMMEKDFVDAYINSGSFIPSSSNRGSVSRIISTSTDAPRFRIEFKNLKWDGTSADVGFQVRYNLNGVNFSGTGTHKVYAAKAAEEEKEKDETTIPPPTPYIIVSQYSFGDDNAAGIEAGSAFPLNINFKNTSQDISLENIVMTISTPDDISITTSSNTHYISALSAGGSMPYSIDLEVKPSASVGSQSIQISFSYQYLSDKERKENKTTENIAIPVTQIDRFEADPITEIPYGVVGEAVYMPVSFINRGKSTTYNISATASANLEIIAQPSHFGNLDPGKSDSLDVTLVPQEPGELFGEIILQYEDENNHPKEVAVPFSMFVEMPYRPEPPMMPDFPIEPPPQNNTPTIILCIIGGLLMAAPIALYLTKRVKAKESEDFDEDF